MPRLDPVSFHDLAGFDEADLLPALICFRSSAAAFLSETRVLRPALPNSSGLEAAFHAALQIDTPDSLSARRFFETHFVPHTIDAKTGDGFVTGYYEPEVAGSLVQTKRFPTPILARPDDLVTFRGDIPAHLDGLAAARRLPDGTLSPYFIRAEIENGAAKNHTQAVVYLKDAVEVFLIQVQGSARVNLPDGTALRLTYAGRNGHPYTSIGKILIAQNHIASDSMTLSRLKQWLRANGLQSGGLASSIMQQNKSYVFFERASVETGDHGPIGGAGVPLTPLTSLAVDRTLWSYGLPFWLTALLPFKSNVCESFSRLMIAQDTGSAIVGAARGDIFFGSGELAGVLAGNIRHRAQFTVLLPKAGI